MINLNVIPNVNDSGILAQLIIFYIGVAAFVLVCCIPPFTLFLPFLIPLIVLVVIYVNISYFGTFLRNAGKQLESLVDNTKTMYDSTTTTLSSNLDSRVQDAQDNITSNIESTESSYLE